MPLANTEKRRETIYADAPEQVSHELAWACLASQEFVDYVIGQPVAPDGRSEWYWVRLPNGDLLLAVYPRGDTYEYVTQDAEMRL